MTTNAQFRDQPILNLDHIVMGADRLEAGLADLTKRLAVEVPTGGKHPLMSTHNRLMSLGDGSFFELIAIDPEGPKPAQPRWYSLDDPATKERLIKRPRALTWVVNTDDLDSVVAHSPVDLGEIIPVQRGDLTWRLTVPKDGHLAGEGLIPAFIEWDQKPPPGTKMPDLGVRLEEISLSHPDPKTLDNILTKLRVRQMVSLKEGPVSIAFRLQTPQGISILD